jgi:RND superfamily putative drug exporter
VARGGLLGGRARRRLPLSRKLNGAEKNDTKAWLPAHAESTKVLDVEEHFQSPNIYPAIVVYQRASGLTAADRPRQPPTPGDSPRSPALARARYPARSRPPTAWPSRPSFRSTLAAPPDSQAAYATINRLRSAAHAVPRASALVGGTTAISLDLARASAHDRSLIIPLILAVVLAILALLLRALVAPLILIATVVLSFAAAMGVSAVFFNHVFGFGGADTAFPLYAFVFLVALGIDYNIFLKTRVREEATKSDARHGALTALAATGGVITSAGCVLAATFAVLATLPSTTLTEIGFTVAFGILLDTIVVRSVLVTALSLDLGHRMWWPARLAHKPDPASAELSKERAAAAAG